MCVVLRPALLHPGSAVRCGLSCVRPGPPLGQHNSLSLRFTPLCVLPLCVWAGCNLAGTNDILRLFIALTGIQTAAGELKGLEAALKAPLANLGLLASEGVGLVKARLGVPDLPDVAWVPSQLSASGSIAAECTAKFGDVRVCVWLGPLPSEACRCLCLSLVRHLD